MAEDTRLSLSADRDSRYRDRRPGPPPPDLLLEHLFYSHPNKAPGDCQEIDDISGQIRAGVEPGPGWDPRGRSRHFTSRQGMCQHINPTSSCELSH